MRNQRPQQWLHRLKSAISIMLVVVGGMFFIHANWLQMKAELSQFLIEQAWQSTLIAPEKSHLPWSWADFWPVAHLQFAEQESVYVLSSTSGQSLAFGPGHLPQSADIGESGQVVIAGHKDSHFSFLQFVKLNDVILLTDRLGIKHHYGISNLDIIDSSREQFELLDGDELVLITCYPFNTLEMNGPMRLVVSAKRIEKSII